MDLAWTAASAARAAVIDSKGSRLCTPRRPTPCLVAALVALLGTISWALIVLSVALRTGGRLRRDSSRVRAVWVPASFDAESRESVARVVAQLAASGVNRIYVDVWNNGRAYFDSPSLRAYAGAEAIGPDLLRWYLDAAPQGIEVHAWLEYGFMACWGKISGNLFAEAALRDGMLIGHHGVWHWLDPLRAAPLLSSMIGEIHERYGVPAQLDDHFGCPHEFKERFSFRLSFGFFWF